MLSIVGLCVELLTWALFPFFCFVSCVGRKSATNLVYKRAIVKAIEELQDHHLRSNIDAIRRHVQASLEGSEHVLPTATSRIGISNKNQLVNSTRWNDTLFLKTLKGLTLDGDIEQCTSVNCEFSPTFKRRRTTSISNLLERQRLYYEHHHHHHNHHLPQSPTSSLLHLHHQYPHEDTKEAPKRKAEHAKLKILSKKVYDKQLYVNKRV